MNFFICYVRFARWTLRKYPSEMKQEKRAKFEDHRPKPDTAMSTETTKFCFRGFLGLSRV